MHAVPKQRMPLADLFSFGREPDGIGIGLSCSECGCQHLRLHTCSSCTLCCTAASHSCMGLFRTCLRPGLYRGPRHHDKLCLKACQAFCLSVRLRHVPRRIQDEPGGTVAEIPTKMLTGALTDHQLLHVCGRAPVHVPMSNISAPIIAAWKTSKLHALACKIQLLSHGRHGMLIGAITPTVIASRAMLRWAALY